MLVAAVNNAKVPVLVLTYMLVYLVLQGSTNVRVFQAIKYVSQPLKTLAFFNETPFYA